jgi:hypothetical protein
MLDLRKGVCGNSWAKISKQLPTKRSASSVKLRLKKLDRFSFERTLIKDNVNILQSLSNQLFNLSSTAVLSPLTLIYPTPLFCQLPLTEPKSFPINFTTNFTTNNNYVQMNKIDDLQPQLNLFKQEKSQCAEYDSSEKITSQEDLAKLCIDFKQSVNGADNLKSESHDYSILIKDIVLQGYDDFGQEFSLGSLLEEDDYFENFFK